MISGLLRFTFCISQYLQSFLSSSQIFLATSFGRIRTYELWITSRLFNEVANNFFQYLQIYNVFLFLCKYLFLLALTGFEPTDSGSLVHDSTSCPATFVNNFKFTMFSFFSANISFYQHWQDSNPQTQDH